MVDVGEFLRQRFSGTPAPQPGLGQLAQAQPTPQPAPQNQGEREGLTQQWQQFLGNPDVRTALFQFGVSVLQPGLPLASRIGLAAGDAAQAVERGRQQNIAGQQQLFENQRALEEEERRRQRLGLEKERVGFEGERVGIAREGLGLEKARVAQGAERIGLDKARFGAQQQQQQLDNERQQKIDELAFEKARNELELQGIKIDNLPLEQKMAAAAEKRAEAELEIDQREISLRERKFEAEQGEIKTFFDPKTQTIVPATNEEAAERGLIPIAGNVTKTTGEFGTTTSTPLGLPLGQTRGPEVGPGKELPQDARDKFSAGFTALQLLDTIEANVGQTGVLIGPINKLAGKLGLNPSADAFTNARSIMNVVSQQLVPDRPSDFDARLVQAFLPDQGFFTAESVNRRRIADLRQLYIKLIRENLAFFKFTGKRIPEEILNAAKTRGIDPNSVKAWDGDSDPLQDSANFIFSRMTDDELVRAAADIELSDRAAARIEKELIKRLGKQPQQ